MTLHPTSKALNRLVFYGAQSDQFPNIVDLDLVGLGGKTDNFIHKLMEPVGTNVCPPGSNAFSGSLSRETSIGGFASIRRSHIVRTRSTFSLPT